MPNPSIPQVPAACTLGHLYAGTELTATPVYLDPDRHAHTVLCGDPGTGKTFAAQRLVYETSRHWQQRSVVFDWFDNWRQLQHAPGLDGMVTVRRLHVAGPQALRWNPLQVSRHSTCADHWRGLCDTFAAVFGLGPARQQPVLQTLLRDIYVRAGVLVQNELVYRRQPQPTPLLGYPGAVRDGPAHHQAQLYSNETDGWYMVRDEVEAQLCGHARETPLVDLTPAQQQVLGRHRSRAVDLHDLLRAGRQQQGGEPIPRGGFMEGITFRVEAMTQGQAGSLLAQGPDIPDICEIVPPPGGICVVEYGPALDRATRAFLAAWAAWQICQDHVATLSQLPPESAFAAPHLQIVFEDADKIFAHASHMCADMWLGTRTRGISLHCITQYPSRLPAGIVNTSPNAIVTQLQLPQELEFVQSWLGPRSKHFAGTQGAQYLRDTHRPDAICSLGDAPAPQRMRPCPL